jgi:hypothetical protein
MLWNVIRAANALIKCCIREYIKVFMKLAHFMGALLRSPKKAKNQMLYINNIRRGTPLTLSTKDTLILA